MATTVGNHDADNANYTYHFNRTNASELGSNKVVGGDYYFKYGNALFIMLNTQDTNVAEHKQFIEQTVAANKDCKWRIVTLHQDIYGSAEHSNEPEITNLRYQLTPIFEQNDIDTVLTGHDHAYSRSKMLLGGIKANETVKKQGSSVINPEGVLYMTAGSSSGSKYYDLVPRQQTYIAHRWQEDVPTYSVVDVTENSLTINTYRTDNDEKIDETFSITKSKGDTTSLNAEKKATTTKPTVVKKPTAVKKVVVAKASAKLKAGKKKVTVKIKKAKTKNTTKTTYTIKSLRSKKKCYVKVRAYKVVKGKKIYGSYSKILKVTVK